MTWLDKLKAARKIFTKMIAEMEGEEKPDAEQIAGVRALAYMTEAIEEIGMASKTPLIDWDKESPIARNAGP